ncbi:MAG TPA: hypothetical protein VM187_09145, partial [Niastella sp.]|nr:hypothetical protein [Niastella sp.]
MHITTRRWNKKEQKHTTNDHGVRMGLCTGKHFARPNPDFFQKRVLSLFEKKMNELNLTEIFSS